MEESINPGRSVSGGPSIRCTWSSTNAAADHRRCKTFFPRRRPSSAVEYCCVAGLVWPSVILQRYLRGSLHCRPSHHQRRRRQDVKHRRRSGSPPSASVRCPASSQPPPRRLADTALLYLLLPSRRHRFAPPVASPTPPPSICRLADTASPLTDTASPTPPRRHRLADTVSPTPATASPTSPRSTCTCRLAHTASLHLPRR